MAIMVAGTKSQQVRNIVARTHKLLTIFALKQPGPQPTAPWLIAGLLLTFIVDWNIGL